MEAGLKPKLAVYKFSSCDGCQLSILNLEDELLDLAAEVNIAYFLEASSEVSPGPYDIALVEGSVSTPDEIERIRRIRATYPRRTRSSWCSRLRSSSPR